MKKINGNQFLIALAIFAISCEKNSPVDEEEEPIIEKELASIDINPANQITSKGATFSASISSNGGADVTSRGFVYNTTGNPSIDNYDGKTSNGNGNGEYIDSTKNLLPQTKYFLKAYATNSVGTAYSNVIEFTTLEQLFSGGTGTQNDPYLIGTPQQLDSIRFYLDKNFKQIANIDLSNFSREDWIPTGYWIPIGEENSTFNGIFNGNDYKINNLKINLPEVEGIGLFGYITNSEIKNVSLDNVDINGKQAGSLIGFNKNGSINNCTANGQVLGITRTGGLVGINYEGNIANCTSNITVKISGSECGGLVGSNFGGTIDSCSTSGEVSGLIVNYNAGGNIGGLIGANNGYLTNSHSNSTVKGGIEVGGLAGSNQIEIKNCYSTGEVMGIGSSTYEIGGLVGWNRGEIQLCYSTSNVSGKNVVGGLVGRNIGEIFSNKALGDVSGIDFIGGLVGLNTNIIRICFSKNKVTGEENIGGIVGKNEHGNINDCYSSTEVLGDKYVGGIVGYYLPGGVTNCYAVGKLTGNNYTGGIIGGPKNIGGIDYCYYDSNTTGQNDTGQGTPKTTVEMMQKYTFFSHWDFGNVWDIEEAKTYPFLKWEKQ